MKAYEQLNSLVLQASPDRVRALLPMLFTETNLAREPMERRIGAFMEWRKRGGFELVRVDHNSELKAKLEIRFPVSDDHWRLHIALAHDEPHCIDEMLMGRAPLPELVAGRSDGEIASAFLSYVEHLGKHDLFSGAALIGRHGEVLGVTATGLASREHDVPNTDKTLFNVASLTKSWTAVAAARLIEDRQMALTDQVQVLLEDKTLDARIEVRHLMSHTSGLGDYFGQAFNMVSKDQVRELDDFLRLTDTFAPRFAPGSDWNYSNIGMLLLGKIIERVSDLPYHDAVKKLVLDPAQMSTAFFPHLDQVHKGCASGYGNKWTLKGPLPINALHSWAVRGAADGCAFASIGDIWSFAQAFNSGRLVSSEMVETMTTAKPELGSADYGYGFALLPQRAIVGHSGGLIGASANLDMIKDPAGWTVIVIANDLSMRTPVMKARQLIGVKVQERDDAKTHLPRAGLTAR